MDKNYRNTKVRNYYAETPSHLKTNQDNQFDFSNINKHRLNKATEEYRLKRTKPLSDSKNTLEECMNLKYL